jgi:hypothetical protein
LTDDLTFSKRHPRLALALTGAIIVALLSGALYVSLVRVVNYADRDFMSLWTGGRALTQGVNPYDASVWGPLREHYGSAWIPDATAPFPLWTFVFFVPLSRFSLDLAASIWLALMIVVTAASLLLLIHEQSDVPMPLWRFLVILIAVFFSRWTTLSLLMGQMTGLLLLVIALFIVLIERKAEFWAGLVIALVAFKPNAFLLFVPLIGVWLIHGRHWRVIAGAAVGGVLMLAVSWAIQPGWISDWMAVSDKTIATGQTPTLWGIAWEITGKWWPAVGFILTIVLTAAGGAVLLRPTPPPVDQAVAFALALSLFITPYTWAYEHLLLFVPLAVFYRYNRHVRGVLPLAFLVGAVILPWGLYWLATRTGADTYSALLPLLVLGLPFVRLAGATPAPQEAQSAAAGVAGAADRS